MNLADNIHGNVTTRPTGSSPWVETASGKRFQLENPDPLTVSIADITEALAKQARYNGHLPVFYSVAQHAVIVSELLPHRLAIYGLLHDAHEAYLGDIVSPVKALINRRAGHNIWDRIVEPIDSAIFSALRLPWPLSPSDRELLHHADLTAMATEVRDMKPESWNPPRTSAKEAASSAWRYWLPEPADFMIRPAPWPKAAALFTKRFIRLAEEFCPGFVLDRQGLSVAAIDGSAL